MLINIMKSKIHRATVTDSNLNYEGSITIDSKLMLQADIVEFEKVQVVNVNNGNRFETYAIPGEEGSGTICLNGAAARLAHSGDKIIIITYAHMTTEEAKAFKPKILLLNEENFVKY